MNSREKELALAVEELKKHLHKTQWGPPTSEEGLAKEKYDKLVGIANRVQDEKVILEAEQVEKKLWTSISQEAWVEKLREAKVCPSCSSHGKWDINGKCLRCGWVGPALSKEPVLSSKKNMIRKKAEWRSE